MIEQVLKTIVMVVVAIIVGIITGIGYLISIAVALANQAKTATPSTIATLKETAGTATVTGQSVASKYMGDLRRMLKVDEDGKPVDLLKNVQERINGSKVHVNN